MGKNFKSSKGIGTLLILLLAGGLAGSALGAVLTPYFPLLKNFTHIGLNTANLNLLFLQLTFGLTISLGPLTILGLIVAFYFYRK